MTEDHGIFPFGQPNTSRPMRRPNGSAKVIVVGVYPSAFHVRWTAPQHLGGGSVAAMAVDVEPTVFWDGDGADFSQRVEQWKEATGFVAGDDPGGHGTISAKSPPSNGSSGQKVAERYLTPLGVDSSVAAFTDVYPYYFVKHETPAKREQGDAIAAEYDAIAGQLGFPPSSLPKRPSAESLVKRASTECADRIRSDLEEADADLVVSLGNEALKTLALLPSLSPEAPADSLQDLYDERRYGGRGKLRINGRVADWLPLAHPGLLRLAAGATTSTTAGGRDWNEAHRRWENAPSQ